MTDEPILPSLYIYFCFGGLKRLNACTMRVQHMVHHLSSTLISIMIESLSPEVLFVVCCLCVAGELHLVEAISCVGTAMLLEKGRQGDAPNHFINPFRTLFLPFPTPHSGPPLHPLQAQTLSAQQKCKSMGGHHAQAHGKLERQLLGTNMEAADFALNSIYPARTAKSFGHRAGPQALSTGGLGTDE